MVASSLRPLGLMPRYVRITAGVHLNNRNTNTLMQCTWTLLLAIACLLAVSGMLSFWLTELHVTTGLSVYRISCRTPSSLPFGFFGWRLVPWQDASTATATGNCLGRQLVSTSLTTTPRSSRLRPSVSRQMVWLNHIGRSWFTWHELISQRSKCHVPFGSMQLSIQLR
jgi:hypothetical protein